MSTLLHVDGTTVEQPLMQALGAGLHDVPLLLSSTQAEMNVMPIERMLGASREQLHEFWDEQFVPLYGRDMVRELRQHYRAYDPPEAAVYALDSDTGPACGLMHVALSAAQLQGWRAGSGAHLRVHAVVRGRRGRVRALERRRAASRAHVA